VRKGTHRHPGGRRAVPERTSQDLACSGEVLALAVRGEGLALAVRGEGLALALTPEGAGALDLPEHTRFDFEAQPALFAQAAVHLAQMAAVGHACIATNGHPNDDSDDRP
jgi:hypothetical protein